MREAYKRKLEEYKNGTLSVSRVSHDTLPGVPKQAESRHSSLLDTHMILTAHRHGPDSIVLPATCTSRRERGEELD